MRIVDVCAFYTPAGGGVRTYVDAKLRAAARFGHEMIVIAPGEAHERSARGPGAVLVTIPSPKLPVDRRYRYFNDERALHAVLDAWQPDHVEASSPWSSATMVGRWQGAASRSLVMHSDPLAAYAYRWLGGVASSETIDRWFGWFWRHLRGLGRMFDMVVCANSQLAERLRSGGLGNTETLPMGVEAGYFLAQASLRDAARAERSSGSGWIGRRVADRRWPLFGGEAWDMVMRAVAECARTRAVGVAARRRRTEAPSLELLADRLPNVAVIPQSHRPGRIRALDGERRCADPRLRS